MAGKKHTMTTCIESIYIAKEFLRIYMHTWEQQSRRLGDQEADVGGVDGAEGQECGDRKRKGSIWTNGFWQRRNWVRHRQQTPLMSEEEAAAERGALYRLE